MFTFRKLKIAVRILTFVFVASGSPLAQPVSDAQAHPCKRGSEIDEMRCLASQVPPAKSTSSCAANAPSGWKTYTNRLQGFCFSYPPAYTQIAEPWLAADEPAYADHLHRLADEGRFLVLKRSGDDRVSRYGVSIDVRIHEPFDLQRLIKDAPTGVESPPEPVQLASGTFYYYGAGGGGVASPDLYFFNLGGRALQIMFNGPNEGYDKTPTYEAKQMEMQLLSTFRTIDASQRK